MQLTWFIGNFTASYTQHLNLFIGRSNFFCITPCNIDRIRCNRFLEINDVITCFKRARNKGKEGIYYRELAHVIMEEDKSQDLYSGPASCRSRKVLVHFQSEPEGLRTRRMDGRVPVWRLAGLRRFSSSLKSGGKSQCPSSNAMRQEELSLTKQNKQKQPFCSLYGPQLIGEGPPTLGRTICFIRPININVNLIPKHSQKHQNKVWPNICVPSGPIKLTHKINHPRVRRKKRDTVTYKGKKL